MATTTPNRAADSALTVTAWTTTLAAGEYASSALFDSSALMDALVGGVIEADTVTGVMAAGETFDIYVMGQYSATATDLGGAIDTNMGADGEESEDVAFVKANMILVKSISLEATAPDTAQGYHWGPRALAAYFNGVIPRAFLLVLHNNTGASLGSGSNVNVEGITYDTS
jgi:hypothetical protein